MGTHATSFRYMKSSRDVRWVVPSLTLVTFTGTPSAGGEGSGPVGRSWLGAGAWACHPALSLCPQRLKWI